MSRNLEYGRVYTSRIQKPHFSGLGVYDPNKVFFKEDPNGKVIVDGKLCIIVRSKSESNLVMIGDKFYKFVVIGDQIWLAENLDMPFAGSSYYNNDPAQSYGLLYHGQDMGDLNDYLLENDIGWHVPYAGELDELSNYVSDNSSLLKSRTSWATNPGTDNYRFAAKAGGNYNGSNFTNKGYYGLFYSQTKNSSNQNYSMNLADNTNNVVCGYTANNNYLSVRLVKDTEPVEIGGRKYKTIRIGNQLWMMENLDYQFEGLNVGGATLQDDIHAWYFNNDAAQSEGLLYNGYAAKYLAEHPELLPEGWRVPETSDFGKLQVAVGGANTAGTYLKNPGTMNGTNYYGFNGLATGMVRSNGAFTDRNTYLRLWTPNMSTTDETAQQFLTLESDKNTATVVSFANDQNVAYSIRLVKDLSTSDSKGPVDYNVDSKEDTDEKPVEDEKKTEEIKVDEKEIKNDETTENKR